MRLAPFLQWTATFTSLAVAQNATEHAETALSALQEWYNETSGIWDTCGWWNGANCMTVLADLAALDSSVLATATSVFANTYTQAPHVNPAPETFYKTVQSGDVQSHYPPSWPEDIWQASATSSNPTAWLDGYYDDAGWWALAWIAAYDLTSNQGYLDTATGIFDDMTQSWPTNCSGGGIYWDDTHTYVNAIANELFLSVAAHLANRVSTNKTYYVNWATEEWNWFQRSGMINSQNTINDGLLDSCANNGATVWSYNQGVVLGGLVELNKAAPNSTYLSSANTIAMAAITALTDSNHILHDTCEPSCAPDATQFKGIFIRNLQLLQSVSPQDEYVTVIQANANSIWANDRNSENQLSIDWAGPFVNPVNASTHSSAMDALVAAIAVG